MEWRVPNEGDWRGNMVVVAEFETSGPIDE